MAKVVQQRHKEVTTTSANGLLISTTFDINGDGAVDGTTQSTTTLHTDGSRSLLEETRYGAASNGDLRSQHAVETSADGRTIVTHDDFDGNGLFDKVDVIVIGVDGSQVETETAFGVGGMRGQTFVTATTADGLTTSVTRAGNIQTIDRSPVNNGSYTWDNGVAPAVGKANIVVFHEIDGSGIETWSSVENSQYEYSSDVRTGHDNWITYTKTATSLVTHEARLDEAAKQAVFSQADQIFDTLLDRNLDFNERETLVYFIANGHLDRSGLIGALLSSAEYQVRYGSQSNAQFVAQLYLNAFGRGTSLSEMESALHDLSSRTVTRAQFALRVNDSVEHGVVGNAHMSTNNFDVIMNPAIFERSLDRVYVENLVRGIVDTFYDREPSVAEKSYFTECLLKGTDTMSAIVNRLLSTNSDYEGTDSHSLYFHQASTTDFVTQAFLNGLGHGPSTEELDAWKNDLDSGRLSKAELVMTIAQSVDHDGAINLHNAVAGGWLYTQVGAGGNDVFYGGSYSDSLVGNAGLDQLYGGGGADQLYGGRGMTQSTAATAVTACFGPRAMEMIPSRTQGHRGRIPTHWIYPVWRSRKLQSSNVQAARTI